MPELFTAIILAISASNNVLLHYIYIYVQTTLRGRGRGPPNFCRGFWDPGVHHYLCQGEFLFLLSLAQWKK